MKVTIKSAEEIEKMRRAGEILAAVHQNLAREIKPGMSTLDIDRLNVLCSSKNILHHVSYYV